MGILVKSSKRSLHEDLEDRPVFEVLVRKLLWDALRRSFYEDLARVSERS